MVEVRQVLARAKLRPCLCKICIRDQASAGFVGQAILELVLYLILYCNNLVNIIEKLLKIKFESHFNKKLYVFLWCPGGVFLHQCFQGCNAQSELSQKIKQNDTKFI